MPKKTLWKDRLYTPNVEDQLNNTTFFQQQAGQSPRPDLPIEIIGVKPVTLKAEKALVRMTEALPFSVVARITRVGFQHIDRHLFFTVVFESGQSITFDNVDTFPTEADIGRIVLSCP